MLWGREGEGGWQDQVQDTVAALNSLGVSKQQPRAATNVGTFLKVAEWPGRLKEAPDRIRRGQKT